MLSPPTRIGRTVPHFALLVFVTIGGSVFSSPTKSSAQDVGRFREFDASMVHSPRELARDLNYLFLKNNPLSDIDPEKLKKLNELGRNFFNSLSEEQKKQAQDFVEQFMPDKGLDSPEGKQLMDQLGVSSEMQSELAKEFGNNDLTDFERFRDLFKNSNRTAANRDSGTQKGGGKKRGVRQSSNSGQLDSGRSELPIPRMPTGQGKSSRKDLPKDLFETLPNELETFDPIEGNKRRGEPSSKSSETTDGPLNDGFKRPPDGMLNQDGRSSGGESNEGLGLSSKKSTRDLPDRLGTPADDAEKSAGSKRFQRGKGASDGRPERNSKGEFKRGASGSGKGGAGGKDGFAGKSGKLSKEALEILKKLETGSKDGDPFVELEKKRNSGAGSAKASGERGKGGVGSGEAAPDVDETFRSWIQMEAIKEGIRQYREGGGPSEFQQRSLESAFKKGFKRIGESLGDTLGKGTKDELSKSEFRDKFDRVLFKAAKDSSQIEAGRSSSAPQGGSGSAESTLDGLLDRISEAAKKKQEQRRKRKMDEWNQSRIQNLGGLPGSGDSSNSVADGLREFNPDDFGTDAFGVAADMLENIPKLPALNLQKLLLYSAIAAAVLMLLYWLTRNISAGPSNSAARKFGRSFQAAKIHSPRDLVEAVDYFIVQKFGARSQWWNAKHAQDVLCAGSPGYSAKISELLKDYVQARYTRSDVTLSPEKQLSYKKTLQELVKEVPGELETSADASQDEG